MLIGGFAGYWALMALLNTALMLYSDWRTLEVDDRLNSMMVGATVPLVVLTSHVWYYYFAVIIAALLVRYVAGLAKLGDGDVNAVAWLYTGAAFIHPINAVTVTASLLLCITAGFTGISIREQFYKKKVKQLPFFIVIMGAVVLTVLYGVY
jgi:hypothetical protein